MDVFCHKFCEPEMFQGVCKPAQSKDFRAPKASAMSEYLPRFLADVLQVNDEENEEKHF